MKFEHWRLIKAWSRCELMKFMVGLAQEKL